MGDEHIELFETAFVQQQVHTFAGRQLAAAMLRVDPPLATPETSRGASVFQLFKDIFHSGPHAFVSICVTKGLPNSKEFSANLQIIYKVSFANCKIANIYMCDD